MFFDTWFQLWNILISGLLSYFVLVIFLRVSGKRTLSKWNMFDFIITIAFGSIFASVILSESVKIIEGVAALFLLILIQFVITKISFKSEWFSKIIKADPTILFIEEKFDEESMRKERVPKSEILAAMRNAGFSSTNDVEAVVLETDGSFSVIKKDDGDSINTLSDIDDKYEDN